MNKYKNKEIRTRNDNYLFFNELSHTRIYSCFVGLQTYLHVYIHMTPRLETNICGSQKVAPCLWNRTHYTLHGSPAIAPTVESIWNVQHKKNYSIWTSSFRDRSTHSNKLFSFILFRYGQSQSYIYIQS